MGRTPGWAFRAWVLLGALLVTLAWAPDARAACGDGVLDGAEQCDDQNTASNDGCSGSCTDEVEVAFTVNAMQILERFCNSSGGEACPPTDNPQNYTYHVEQVRIAGQGLVIEPGPDVTPVEVCADDPSNFPASYSTLQTFGVNDEFNCAHWVRPRLVAREGQQVFVEECPGFTGNVNPVTPGVGAPRMDDGVCLRPLWHFTRFVDPAQGPFEIELELSVGGRHCGQLGGCPPRTRLDLRRGPETTLRLSVAFDQAGPSYFVVGDTAEPNPRIVDGCPASNPDCFDLYQARVFFDLTFDGVQPACTAGNASCGAPPAMTPEPGEWGYPCMLATPTWGCPVVVNTCNADGPCSVEQLAAEECVGAPTEGFRTCQGYSWSECNSVLINASEQESNNIDDNCDGYPDDEQCDGIDNNGNGEVDESIGSCLVRIALFPVCFEGSDDDFQARADEAKNLMIEELKLSNCTQNTHWEVILPSELNVDCAKEPCAQDGFDEYEAGVMSKFDGVTTGTSGNVLGRALEFDGLMGLTDQDLCDNTNGVSNRQVLWAEKATTALHEFGHLLGLFDEYCSTAAGGPTNCNWGAPPKLGQSCSQDSDCTETSPRGGHLTASCGPDGCGVPVNWTPNWLGEDLLCSPEQDDGCCGNVFGIGTRDDCESDKQNYCCEGNIAEFGRCFMTSGALDPRRGFCERCQAHLLSPPNPRQIACWNQFKCGNLTIDPREGCDGSTLPDGTPADVTCTSACALSTCGDGTVQAGEACDDGNADNEDDCSNRCTQNGTVTETPQLCADTQAPMNCAFRHIGNAPYMVSMSVTVGPPDAGLNHFEITHVTFGSGRLPLGAAPVGGRYKFEVADSAGSVFVEHADPSFWPDLGTSSATTTEPYSSVPLSFRFPVPPTVSSQSKLRVEASVDDGPPVRSTLNGEPPVAELMTPPQPLECGTDVILDASASFDPDGDTLRYLWSPASVFDDPSRVDAIASLPLGETLVELTVSDGLDPDTQSVTLTVQDTLAPLVVPVGEANLVLECAIDEYTELGANAVDICDTQVDVVIGGDIVDTHDPGTYVVSYESTDDSGNVGSADRVVDVRDTMPPTISVSVSPNVLWPPNHSMHEITPTIVVTDACDATPSVALVGIVSDEPQNGPGDGNTAPDIEVTPDGRIRLRAERNGAQNGREYTLTFRATDASGNTADAQAKVTVPHSKPR